MKIDTKNIPDYDKLTPEQKLAALEKLELPDPDYSGFVPKDTADKYASEAAALKKQLRERMTAEEADKQQREEAQAQLVAEVEALRKERALDRSKTRLLELGWSGKLADSAAHALVGGEMDKVFDVLAKFQEEFTRQIKGEMLKELKRPPAGDSTGGVSREQFEKMSLTEKAKLYNDQPEVYAQMRNGG